MTDQEKRHLEHKFGKGCNHAEAQSEIVYASYMYDYEVCPRCGETGADCLCYCPVCGDELMNNGGCLRCKAEEYNKWYHRVNGANMDAEDQMLKEMHRNDPFLRNRSAYE